MSDLMSTAANGLGGTVQLAYTAATAFENTNNPPPKFTVTSLTAQDGRGWSSTTTFSYSGGKMDRFERRFLGFRQVRKTLPCIAGETACPYVDTTLSQDLASAGSPERVEYRDGSGQLLRASKSQYTTNGTTVPRVSLLTGQFAYTYDAGAACEDWPCAGGKRTYNSYTYDSFANAITSVSWGDYDIGGDEVTVRRTYNPNTADYIVDRVASQATFSGTGVGFLLAQTEYWYDGQGASLPPTQGYVTATRGWLDTEGRWVPRAMAYDTWGNLTSVTVWPDPGTALTTTTAYDATYHVLPISVTNGAGETESAVWDPTCGVPTLKTNPSDQSSTLQYDALCRLTRTDFPLGAYEMRDYLDIGDPTLQRTWVRTPPAVAGTGKQYVMDYFDGLGRTYRSVRKGPAANQRIFSDTTFNPRGQVASQSAPYYENESPLNTTYTYDPMDRLKATSFPAGPPVTKTYGLWSETTNDEHGHPTTVTYDAYGRAITQDNWRSGQPVRTWFHYDLLGQLVGTTDALGNNWFWVFDSLGRNIQKTDPDAGTWSFEYDDAGRLKFQVDAKHQRIAFTYDRASRLLSKTPVPDVVPSQAVTMRYGEGRPGFFNVGFLTTVHNAAADQKTDYDALGRAVKQVQTLGGVPYTVERRYDIGGFLRGITYPDGEAVGTTTNPLGYDQAGRLTSIPGIVNDVLYDAAGRPTRQSNGNGTLTERGYSTRGFLTGIRTGGPVLIQDLTYQPDGAGLLQRVTSSLPNVLHESWSYAYDDLHRLTSATDLSSSESQTWALDSIGRITFNSRVGSYAYGPTRPHAPSSVNGNPYSYDANGNLTSGGGRIPQWNVYNQPTSISGAQFLYDGLGERVSKTSTQGTSLYPFGDDYEVTNGVVTKYISVAGLGVVAKKRGQDPYWMHTDRLGSIQAITGKDGALVWRKTYRPYGEAITETTSHEESRGWIDQRQDDETGLTYLHARYYDPALGVFLSPDPIGASLNTYGYGSGDPVNRADPSGLDDTPPPPPPVFPGGLDCPGYPGGETPDGCPVVSLWWLRTWLDSGNFSHFLQRVFPDEGFENNYFDRLRERLERAAERRAARAEEGTKQGPAPGNPGTEEPPAQGPGGSGNSNPPTPKLRFPSQEPRRPILLEGFTDAWRRLGNERCNALFGGNGREALEGTSYYFTPMRGRTAAGRPEGGGSFIVINTRGAYVNPNRGGDYELADGSSVSFPSVAAFRGFVLLHENGHVAPQPGWGADTNPALNAQHSRAVLGACF